MQEAVAVSLKDGLTGKCLFNYARALKAFEISTGARLQPTERENAFTLWWHTAKPPNADFDEWRYVFKDCFEKAKAPWGADPLKEAIRRADSNPPPLQAARYTSPKIKRLVAVCYHLQILAGENRCFLSLRSVANIIGTKNLHTAAAFLNGLVGDGVLIEVTKGIPGGKRATRFRFNLAQPGPAKESQTNAE